MRLLASETVEAVEDLGTDELVFHPETDDIDEITRLAEIVLENKVLTG